MAIRGADVGAGAFLAKFMSLTLYQYKPMFDLPSASPLCIKLETYLRMAKIEHSVSILKGRSPAPTRKAPYVEENGQLLTDSGLIINHLEHTRGHPVDGGLTLAERAESLALQRLMEEHLYWVIVYMRWVDPKTRQDWRPHLANLIRVPKILLPVLARQTEKSLTKVLYAQGVGRHPAETIWQFGISDVQALAHWLGARPWGFGDKPTVFDACLYSFVGLIVRTPWDNPLKTATLKHSNLVGHFDRMLATYFPEFVS